MLYNTSINKGNVFSCFFDNLSQVVYHGFTQDFTQDFTQYFTQHFTQDFTQDFTQPFTQDFTPINI